MRARMAEYEMLTHYHPPVAANTFQVTHAKPFWPGKKNNNVQRAVITIIYFEHKQFITRRCRELKSRQKMYTRMR